MKSRWDNVEYSEFTEEEKQFLIEHWKDGRVTFHPLIDDAHVLPMCYTDLTFKMDNGSIRTRTYLTAHVMGILYNNVEEVKALVLGAALASKTGKI